MTGYDLVNQARTYLGVRFVHAGRSRHGVDCIGLLLCVVHDLELTDYDVRNYTRDVDPEQMRRGIEHLCDPVRNLKISAGDVFLFEIGGIAQHVGMATGDRTLIHTYQTVGRVVEHRLDGWWLAQAVGHYRFRGLD